MGCGVGIGVGNTVLIVGRTVSGFARADNMVLSLGVPVLRVADVLLFLFGTWMATAKFRTCRTYCSTQQSATSASKRVPRLHRRRCARLTMLHIIHYGVYGVQLIPVAAAEAVALRSNVASSSMGGHQLRGEYKL